MYKYRRFYYSGGQKIESFVAVFIAIHLWLKARLTQLVPISFCSYNFGRQLCGDWNGPGFCLCSACKAGCRYPESSGCARPLSSIPRRGWDQTGLASLCSRQSLPLKCSHPPKYFLERDIWSMYWERRRRCKQEKNTLHFPWSCTPQVQPCSSVRCVVFIFYCTVCSYASAFQ